MLFIRYNNIYLKSNLCNLIYYYYYMKKENLYLWKKVYPSESLLEHVYLDENGERIHGNIVSSNFPELNQGRVIYMGKAVKHVGTYGNKYMKSNQL